MVRKLELITFCLAFFAMAPVATARETVAIVGVFGSEGWSHLDLVYQRLSDVLIGLDRFEIAATSNRDAMEDPWSSGPESKEQLNEVFRIGHHLGVDFTFTANVDRLETTWVSIEGSGYFTADATLTVQVVSVTTGKLLGNIVTNGHGTDARNRSAAEEKALRSCFNPGFTLGLRSMFKIKSSVLGVDSTGVIFSAGESTGIRRGTRFEVLGSGDRKPIGVVQVTQIGGETSQGRVVWASQPIEPGDKLQEMPKDAQVVGRVTFQPVNVSKADRQGHLERETGIMLHVGGAKARSFDYSLGFNLGASVGLHHLRALKFTAFAAKEVVLIPGSMTLFGRATVGLTDVTQDGWAKGTSAFFAGTAGVMLYRSHEQGPRYELGVTFPLATPVTVWQRQVGEGEFVNVTGQVPYPKVGFGGATTYLGRLYPLGSW